MSEEKGQENNSNDGTDKKKMISFWKSRAFNQKRDIILILTNIILALGSIASLILIYYMTTEQNDISEDLFKAQIKRDSLDNIKDSILLKREENFFFTTNRANISAKISELRIWPNEEVVLNMEETNWGNTTAYNVRYLAVRMKTPITEQEFIHYTQIPESRGTSIGANQTISFKLYTGTITAKEYRDIMDGKVILYFFIVIFYETLGETKMTYYNIIEDIKRGYSEIPEYTGAN